MLVALTATVTATAQNSAFTNGILLNSGRFTPVDMMRYSTNNYSLTTARAAAMGGAFTSLGGDLASMGINPAGIGMYNSSVWGFSPSLAFNNSTNNFGSDTKTRFSFNNIGTVLNLLKRSSGVVSFNLGLSYNRSDDFNYSGVVNMPASNSGSILNIFQQQLNGLYNDWHPLQESDLRRSPFDNPNIYVNEWGAVLGYQSGLFPASNGMYGTAGLPENGMLTPSLRYNSSGYVGEYNIAGGMNINNILYLGFDFGFRDIYQNMSLYYSEVYDDNYSGTAQQYLRQMDYNQHTYTQGSAFNFKIGAIVRPIPELRIGVAYHTPSYSNIHREYNAGMGTQRYGSTESNYYNTYVAGYEYSFNTPSRLLTGASLTLGNYLALSFDYECVWYNKMHYVSNSFEEMDAFAADINRDYKPANNFRVGLEIKPLPSFAIRAGYAYYDSPIREKDATGEAKIFSDIIRTSSSQISAGVGFWLGHSTTLDIAYVYSRENIAPYDLYYYTGYANLPEGSGDKTYKPENSVSGSVLNRHMVTASVNFLF